MFSISKVNNRLLNSQNENQKCLYSSCRIKSSLLIMVLTLLTSDHGLHPLSTSHAHFSYMGPQTCS